MDAKEIKAILELMGKHGLCEFELEKPEGKIRLKKYAGAEPAPVSYAPAPAPMPAPAPATGRQPAPRAGSAAPAAAAPAAPAPAGDTQPIVSPMVGTFYRASGPDAAPFIEVGQEVNPETVVCIIEAMKVMNEIKAETRGIVTEVLAQNAQPVEFGKPLFNVRPV